VELIDGRAMARRLSDGTAAGVEDLKARGVEPTLAVVLVGSDPASTTAARSRRGRGARSDRAG